MSRNPLATGARPHVPALQVLIVVAIAALVVTLAIPAYAARARDTVLRENARTLEFEVKSYLALDLEPTYVSDREADADAKLDVGRGASEVIANALGGYGGGVSAYFVNPTSGSRMVVCESDLSATPDGTPPAVWITDDKRYSYAAFVASSTTKDRLGGTLMLVFIIPGVRAGGIEVFYVDPEGERSATATTLAI